MTDDAGWQCADCGTLIDGPESRMCSIRAGIHFHLADDVLGEERVDVPPVVAVGRALERLSDEGTQV